MDSAGQLTRGRDAYDRQAWREAYEGLTAADRSASLEPGELEMLATAAFMLGREQEFRDGLERAYREHLEAERTAGGGPLRLLDRRDPRPAR